MARRAKIIEDRPTSRRVGALGALWPFVRPYRGQLAVALAALVLTSAISLVLPLAVRRRVYARARRAIPALTHDRDFRPAR